MIIRKKLNVPHMTLAKSAVVAASLAALAGCNALGNLIEPDRVEYRSASKAPTLDVPPDLTQLQRDSRYAIPDASRGTATASSFNLQQGKAVASGPVASQVLVTQIGDVRVERSGDQRWLVVKRAPDALWTPVKDFWQEMGFVINIETPAAGVMETDWAENRAKIPHDIIRDTVGKVFDSLYATGERDKFRTRIERTPDGGSEIYISHRGAEEV
ncbi:MAG: outer membrane protein assembly factor BamC, partial [Burkholderiales bacterium]|nr:outer membrane protein assembly factor BamC [Burkholderiales bacterium]